jgi:hypothetical protein
VFGAEIDISTGVRSMRLANMTITSSALPAAHRRIALVERIGCTAGKPAFLAAPAGPGADYVRRHIR